MQIISYSSLPGTCLPVSLEFLALLLPSGGTWEGGLKSQGILNRNMTGSATHCYLMEQAEMSVLLEIK